MKEGKLKKRSSGFKLFGLIGYPVKHTFSPVMQNAAFCAKGIDGIYLPMEIKPQALTKTLKEFVAKYMAGANVTIPHKVRAKEYIARVGSLSIAAKRIGAVNTITIKNGRILGDNTDGLGFLKSLKEDLSFDPRNKRIVVLGSGGAARAIVMSLGKRPKRVTICDIYRAPLNRLKKDYIKHFGSSRIEGIHNSSKKGRSELCERIIEADLLVNATSVGMKRSDPLIVDPRSLHKDLRVYDCIYNPARTKLLKCARAKGLKATNGSGMLLYQGAASFGIWTGVRPPVKVMRKALTREMRRRA